jgi:ABC-2 type transport system ATP-binding protein
MFGSASRRRARARIGFLPENPYVYPHLTPREFVEMSGRLRDPRPLAAPPHRWRSSTRPASSTRPIARCAALSKGMLQRSALAAALVADPEMLILDEPMSGLDPVGRKEVRDIIFEERDRRPHDLLFHPHPERRRVALRSRHHPPQRRSRGRWPHPPAPPRRRDPHRDHARRRASRSRRPLRADELPIQERPDVIVVEATGLEAVESVLRRALDGGAHVVEVTPRKETLEDLFMRRALCSRRSRCTACRRAARSSSPSRSRRSSRWRAPGARCRT